jgi:hypothetical protein
MSATEANENQTFLPAQKVGKHFGYTRDYIIILVKEGKIDGRKMGHRWMVSMPSAEKFFSEAKVQRAVRNRELRRERQEERIRYAKMHSNHTGLSQAPLILAVCVMLSIFMFTGYAAFRTPLSQEALAYRTEAGIIERLAVSLYNFFSFSTETVTTTRSYGRENFMTNTPPASTSVATTPREYEVHTSFVVDADEVMTDVRIAGIRDSFSDEVSVSIDPHDPDTGVIIPHF